MRTVNDNDAVAIQKPDPALSRRREAPQPILLSVDEAAVALRIGRTKLYELIARGQIKSVHIGRSCRIPTEAVHAFVSSLRED